MRISMQVIVILLIAAIAGCSLGLPSGSDELLNPDDISRAKPVGVGGGGDDGSGDDGGSTGGITPGTDPGYAPPGDWNLVWSDEFDGTSLDTSIWSYDIGTGPNNDGWGNWEEQYYTDRPENVSVGNGMLTITAIKESYAGSSYTSGRIHSQDKYEPQYGRIDLRAYLPMGSGVWPAFWMLGSNYDTAGWPYCGELDIMEMFGDRTGTTMGTVHWWAEDTGVYASYGGETSYDTGSWHTWSVVWDESFITWYLDGVQFHVIDTSPYHLDEFRQPMFMLLNLAVGGTRGAGKPQRNTWPQSLYVDYVRVYN